MKDHPIAAGLWLTLVVGGLGFLAYYMTGKGMAAEHGEESKAFSQQVDEALEAGKRGQYELAMKQLEHLIEEYPDNPGLYFNLGIAQRAAEKYDDADQSFARVLELDPKDYEAQVERASIQKEKGNLDRALEILEAVPMGKGQLNLRLREDPLWNEDLDNPRLKALREKHGVSDETDTSLQMLRQKRKNAPQGVMIP